MSAYQSPKFIFIALFVCAALLLSMSCGRTAKTDLRRLVPRETLVYLETENLAALLNALTASAAFQTLAADQPDFSALKNVQIAVAVTGFDASGENSALNLKPRFVAVAVTDWWNFQTVSVVKNQLDVFVRRSYGADTKLETNERDGGVFYQWTAADKRQVFAFTAGSLIYFGNDAAAFDKCLAIKNGAAESLAQNEFFNRRYAAGNLAFGYVSKAGIAQIADLAGVSAAVGTTDEADGKSLIARVLPALLRNTTEEIVWTTNRVDGGIEDKFSVVLTAENHALTKEIFQSKKDLTANDNEFTPADVYTATSYNLENPALAWRGAVLLAAKNSDFISGKILSKFSGQLLAPYGIADAETFLSAVESPIITTQFDAEGERSAAIFNIKDAAKIKAAISTEIDFKRSPEKSANAEIWFSDDRNSAAAFVGSKLILGEGAGVLRCLERRNQTRNPAFQRFRKSQSVAATFGTDADSAEKIAAVLGGRKDENRKLATFYTIETRLTADGFERVTVSDFGFGGTILGNLN